MKKNVLYLDDPTVQQCFFMWVYVGLNRGDSRSLEAIKEISEFK